MNKTMKTSLGSVVGIILGTIIYQLISHFVFAPPTFDEQLMKISSEINKSCPFMVDQDTRLDNTMGGPGKSITYNYTLVNYLEEDINSDELRKFITPQLINNIKINDDMKTFRENEVSLKYNYKDKVGKPILSVTISPSDYGD